MRKIMLCILLLLSVSFGIAANDPGHDSLYVLLTGDSNVSGSINITQNLTASYIRAATLLYGEQIDIRANGTVLGVSSRPAIQAVSTGMYLDGNGNLYMNTQGSSSGIVQMGDVSTNDLTLNVSGNTVVYNNVSIASGNLVMADTIRITNSGAGFFAAGSTVDGSAICTESNGLCSSGGSGNGWSNTSSTTSTGLNVEITSGNLTLGSGGHVFLPSDNDGGSPSLAFGDGDTGIYESGDDQLIITTPSVGNIKLLSDFGLARAEFVAHGTSIGPVLRFATASSSLPTLVPHSQDTDTGVGRAASDQLSLIAGGSESLRVFSNGNVTIFGNLSVDGSKVCTSANGLCGGSSSLASGWRNDSGSGNVSLVDSAVNVSVNTLFIDNTNGRVGIGDSTPSYVLDVNGQGQFQSTSNPGVIVGDGSTGYVQVGGSIISDAAGDLTIDSDSGIVGIPDRLDVQSTNARIRLADTDGNTFQLRSDSEEFSINDVTDAGSPLRLHIDTDGNVGIGTSSLSAKLHILSSGAATNPLIVDAASSSAQVVVNEDVGGDFRLLIENGSGTTNVQLHSNDDSYLLGGRLGIGTNAPAEDLEIEAPLPALQLEANSTEWHSSFITFAGAGNSIWSVGIDFDVNTTDDFYIYDWGASQRRFMIDTAGNVGIGSTSPDGLQVETAVSETADGSDNVRLGVAGGTPRIIFEDGETASQWEIDNSAGDLRIFQPGSVKVTIKNDTGKVGIGTTNPQYKLHLNGLDETADFMIVDATPIILLNETGTGKEWYFGVDGSNLWLGEDSTSSASRRITFEAGGSIGIGTVTPDVPLAIDTGNSHGLQLSYDAAGFTTQDGFTIAHSAGDVYLNQRESADMNLATNNAVRLSIDETGNVTIDSTTFFVDAVNNRVGIGTTDPADALHVEGEMTFDVGRGDVFFENNANDNSDGGGITLRTANNPGSAGGSIFAVRSSGQAARLWVGQAFTSTGLNDFYVGSSSSAQANDTSLYAAKIAGSGDSYINGGDLVIGATTASAELDVGGGSATNIDGTDDLLVADDAEIDGDLYVEGSAYGVAPTMYLTSTAQNGAHNADDDTDCGTGYHMCTLPEVLHGGRQIEDSGTGRDTAPYDDLGWVDPLAGLSSVDCTDWSSTSTNGLQCEYTTSGWSCGTGVCTVSQKIWCCSD